MRGCLGIEGLVTLRAMASELDDFPEHLDPHLPPWNERGTLPIGDYGPSDALLRERLASGSPRREEIHRGWLRHRQALAKAGLPAKARELLDGSFTTEKLEPGDLDLAVEVALDGRALAALDAGSPLLHLLSGPGAKFDFSCDAYPIFCLPKSDPDYERVTLHFIRYWTKWFGTDRLGRPKGRVWSRVGGVP